MADLPESITRIIHCAANWREEYGDENHAEVVAEMEATLDRWVRTHG